MNGLVILMISSFIFTLVWGLAPGLLIGEICSNSSNSNHSTYYNVPSNYYCFSKDMGNWTWIVITRMWIVILSLSSLTCLGSSGYYLRTRIRIVSPQTQTLGFNTNAIELSPVSRVEGLTAEERDMEKEITVFERRKKLAQLKKEVRDLERDGLQATVVIPSGSSS